MLLGLVPQFLNTPPVFGVYWSYVFPFAILGAASVHNGDVFHEEGTAVAWVLAWMLVVLALVSLVAVFARMVVHQVQVLRRKATWDDPLVAVGGLSPTAGTHAPLESP